LLIRITFFFVSVFPYHFILLSTFLLYCINYSVTRISRSHLSRLRIVGQNSDSTSWITSPRETLWSLQKNISWRSL
jgi:hypothetical protein